MPTVIGPTKADFDRAEMEKRGQLQKNHDAIEHLAKHFKSKIDRKKDHKNPYTTGEDALLHLKNAKVQLNLHENENGVHLMNINVKDKNDLTKNIRNTGYGKEIIESLKQYSDTTKKPFHVIGATKGASENFWDKIKGLKRNSVSYVDPHGKKQTDNESYSYDANSLTNK